MSLILYLIVVAIVGLIVGALARLALPGPDPMSIPMTMAIGVGGSFIAGLVSLLLFGGRNGGGFFLSFVFAVLLVWLVRRSRERRGGGAVGRRY